MLRGKPWRKSTPNRTACKGLQSRQPSTARGKIKVSCLGLWRLRLSLQFVSWNYLHTKRMICKNSGKCAKGAKFAKHHRESRWDAPPEGKKLKENERTCVRQCFKKSNKCQYIKMLQNRVEDRRKCVSSFARRIDMKQTKVYKAGQALIFFLLD